MEYKVKHARILCSAKCILNYNGSDYSGIIENISLSGALVKLDNNIPSGVRPSDKCYLILCSNQDSYPVKYTCKVTRLDTSVIGIEFLELNIM